MLGLGEVTTRGLTRKVASGHAAPARPWVPSLGEQFFCPASPSAMNVYTPAGARTRDLPVMVWIHGGAFIAGESNDYNPAALVRHGVIVVTIKA